MYIYILYYIFIYYIYILYIYPSLSIFKSHCCLALPLNFLEVLLGLPVKCAAASWLSWRNGAVGDFPRFPKVMGVPMKNIRLDQTIV